MYNLSKCIKNKVLVFLPEGIGGAEHVGVTIAKMLRKDNFKVKIVVIGPKDGLIKTIIPSDFNISYIAKSKYRWFLIYELIKKENPSVVFAPCRNISRDIISDYPPKELYKDFIGKTLPRFKNINYFPKDFHGYALCPITSTENYNEKKEDTGLFTVYGWKRCAIVECYNEEGKREFFRVLIYHE